MTTPAFTGLTITIFPSPFCDAPGWIARLPYFPHIDGIGKEPEDALKALRENWHRATTIVHDESYHLRKSNENLEDTLMGKYESLQEAVNDAKALSWMPGETWYITHQNRIMAQGNKESIN